MEKAFKVLLISMIFLYIGNTGFTQSQQEKIDWETAKKSNTFAAYQSFIVKYPDSKIKLDLEKQIYNLIISFPDVRYVIYQDFRLRDKPGSSGNLVAKLPKDQEVKVIEKSKTKDEITVDQFSAIDSWYKVGVNDTMSGWIFGAGLATSDDFFKSCKLFIETFPASEKTAKVKELFLNSDCNLWQNTIKEDNKSGYSEYLKYFPNGIYSEDAALLMNYIDTTTCFYYSQGKEYMNMSKSVKIKITENEVGGVSSSELVDFSGSDGVLTGKRVGKILILQNEVENSDSDEIVIQEETYMLNKQGLQEIKPGKNLLLKVDCK